MPLKDLPLFSFRAALTAVRERPLYRHPSAFLWQRCLSISNQFCEAVVNTGFLTWEQMVNASCRYCIGASKRGGVIFWQIDHEGRVRDGKVMYYLSNCHRNKSKEAHPTWVSTLLARREASFGTQRSSTAHCFFGLHLLGRTDEQVLEGLTDKQVFEGRTDEQVFEGRTEITENTEINPHIICEQRPFRDFRDFCVTRSVCVVEAEKTAFILSELYPDQIWLATGGLGELQPDKFRPLRGRKVILFPDTDPDGTAFRRWSETADLVMQSPFWEGSPPIRVSPLLELHATEEQKQRKIDLVDFLFEHGSHG